MISAVQRMPLGARTRATNLAGSELHLSARNVRVPDDLRGAAFLAIHRRGTRCREVRSRHRARDSLDGAGVQGLGTCRRGCRRTVDHSVCRSFVQDGRRERGIGAGVGQHDRRFIVRNRFLLRTEIPGEHPIHHTDGLVVRKFRDLEDASPAGVGFRILTLIPVQRPTCVFWVQLPRVEFWVALQVLKDFAFRVERAGHVREAGHVLRGDAVGEFDRVVRVGRVGLGAGRCRLEPGRDQPTA